MINTSVAAVYQCEGCGMRITLLGRREPPDHRLCSVCRFLCLHMGDDPEGFWQLYTQTRPADPEYDARLLAASRVIVRAKMKAGRP